MMLTCLALPHEDNNMCKKMADAQARPQGQQHQQGQKLALAELRTVKWVASQPLVKEAFTVVKPRYISLKQVAILGWFIVFYEMVFVWWWTFAHNLPWPGLMLSMLDQTDSLLVRLLDFAQQRLEWWWDAWGVRLMWLRETFLAKLDQYITLIDTFLLRVQDILATIIAFLIKPIRITFEYFNASSKKRTSARGREDGLAESPGRGVASNDDDDDDTEEWDDYPSDASSGSQRLLKNDPQGQSYNIRLHTKTAEERLRAAMYHRVKKELRLMRKNSIRFSYGIVNYARQMVQPRVRPYAESFQAYCQKWAKAYEIPELMAPLQEEWSSDKHLLAKVVALARALCVVYLGFLLRLVKGKKSRRTRSMRSESLRRRTQNLSCSGSSLPLSPSALQQSSEPTPSPHLEVQVSLPEPALKQDEEDSGDSRPKNSTSEQNPPVGIDSDRMISPINEEDESDEDLGKKENDNDISEGSVVSVDDGGKDSGFSDKKSEDEDGVPVKHVKKEVTMSPQTQAKQKSQKLRIKKTFF
ncbi:uncharacterized protein [Cherax quadricarinatus]